MDVHTPTSGQTAASSTAPITDGCAMTKQQKGSNRADQRVNAKAKFVECSLVPEYLYLYPINTLYYNVNLIQ